MTQASIPVPLPPSDIVRRLGEMLETGVPRTVLDVGMGEGRNSLHVARMGHMVTGITKDPEEIAVATQLAERQGIADLCNFQQGDVRTPRPGMFDIALSNEVVHLLPKKAGGVVLSLMRGQTRQGGLNIVSGYLVEPGTANITNTERCFAPGELRTIYQRAGWQELYYEEEILPITHVGNKENIFSRAKIIAQRPWLHRGAGD
jgi:SAM-dependent methyltransferase